MHHDHMHSLRLNLQGHVKQTTLLKPVVRHVFMAMHQDRPSAEQSVAVLTMARDGIGAVHRGVALGRQKICLPGVGPVFKPFGVQAVESAHFLQAHDVGIKLLYRVTQVVNFESTCWAHALDTFVNVISSDFESFDHWHEVCTNCLDLTGVIFLTYFNILSFFMKNTSLATLSVALCLSTASAVHAEPTVTWGLSAGMNKYTEANMKLVGPELGLHVRAADVFPNTNWLLEADVLLGKQNYTSTSTGSMRGVGNLETRWRVVGEMVPDSGWSTGLALHTLWNDLQGIATDGNGQTYSGYQRSAQQVWLPVRWAPGNGWTYEFGKLINGKHTSALSQADPAAYTDITNTQKGGTYLQASVSLGLPNGDRLLPFVRVTHLSTSDVVTMGGKNWTEPNNHRLQTGVIWQFVSP